MSKTPRRRKSQGGEEVSALPTQSLLSPPPPAPRKKPRRSSADADKGTCTDTGTCKEREIVRMIAERLRTGVPLVVVLRETGMPSADVLDDWKEKDPEIARTIARARSEGFDAIAAECLQIADDVNCGASIDEDGKRSVDRDALQRSKLRVDTRLKLLAKWDPKRYGDKVEVTGDAAGNKTDVTVNVALSKARLKALQERRKVAAKAGRS